MIPRLAATVALGAVLVTRAAVAQETSVAFATYYVCDQTRQTRADTIVQQVIAPIYDRYLAAGDLTAWGWSTHLVGGAWRRVGYSIASDRDQLLEVRAQFIEEMINEHPEAFREFNSICGSHEDYIWGTVAASQAPTEVGQDRSPAGVSTYHVCDLAGQARADTLVMDVFAPVFNRHVEAGDLNSWSWLAHQVGGKFRRLAVYDGADHTTILNTLDQVIAELQNEHPAAFREFGEICSTHEDYWWNLMISRP